MKKNYIKLLTLFLGLTFVTACEEKEDLDTELVGLGGESWVKGPVDNWLDQNYVTPYNIEVKYRFDRYEVSLGRVLTPPREDKVIPVMETIKTTWIEPYNL